LGPLRPRYALPLILVFEAGLATGLSRFLAPPAVLVVLAGTALLLHGRRWALLPPFAALGLVLGALARDLGRSSCAAVLPAGVASLSIQLL
jgi:hypothetical protein